MTFLHNSQLATLARPVNDEAKKCRQLREVSGIQKPISIDKVHQWAEVRKIGLSGSSWYGVTASVEQTTDQVTQFSRVKPRFPERFISDFARHRRIVDLSGRNDTSKSLSITMPPQDAEFPTTPSNSGCNAGKAGDKRFRISPSAQGFHSKRMPLSIRSRVSSDRGIRPDRADVLVLSLHESKTWVSTPALSWGAQSF